MSLDKLELRRLATKERIKYTYNFKLQLHTLLDKKQVAKAHLSVILGVSAINTAIRLINQPLNLTMQQVLNLSYCLNVSYSYLSDVIFRDVKYSSNCAAFENSNIELIPENIKLFAKSDEWINR